MCMAYTNYIGIRNGPTPYIINVGIYIYMIIIIIIINKHILMHFDLLYTAVIHVYSSNFS